MNFEIPRLPLEVRKNKHATIADKVSSETTAVFFIPRNPDGTIKIDYPEEGGIYIQKFGAEVKENDGKHVIDNVVPLLYRSKGFPDRDALAAINIVKRYLIGALRMLIRPIFWPSWALFALLPRGVKVKILFPLLAEFNELGERFLSPFYLQDNRYMGFTRELMKAITVFLTAVGFPPTESKWAAENIGMCFEFDSAYRDRVKDILSETSATQLTQQPTKEIKRLTEIFLNRDLGSSTRKKGRLVGKLLRMALLYPSMRQAFKKTLSEITFENLQLDEADKYHLLHTEPGTIDRYQFMGMNIDQRRSKWLEIHNGNPPQAVILNDTQEDMLTPPKVVY